MPGRVLARAEPHALRVDQVVVRRFVRAPDVAFHLPAGKQRWAPEGREVLRKVVQLLAPVALPRLRLEASGVRGRRLRGRGRRLRGGSVRSARVRRREYIRVLGRGTPRAHDLRQQPRLLRFPRLLRRPPLLLAQRATVRARLARDRGRVPVRASLLLSAHAIGVFAREHLRRGFLRRDRPRCDACARTPGVPGHRAWGGGANPPSQHRDARVSTSPRLVVIARQISALVFQTKELAPFEPKLRSGERASLRRVFAIPRRDSSSRDTDDSVSARAFSSTAKPSRRAALARDGHVRLRDGVGERARRAACVAWTNHRARTRSRESARSAKLRVPRRPASRDRARGGRVLFLVHDEDGVDRDHERPGAPRFARVRAHDHGSVRGSRQAPRGGLAKIGRFETVRLDERDERAACCSPPTTTTNKTKPPWAYHAPWPRRRTSTTSRGSRGSSRWSSWTAVLGSTVTEPAAATTTPPPAKRPPTRGVLSRRRIWWRRTGARPSPSSFSSPTRARTRARCWRRSTSAWTASCCARRTRAKRARSRSIYPPRRVAASTRLRPRTPTRAPHRRKTLLAWKWRSPR